MHKVLRDAITKCRMHRNRRNKDEQLAYCAGCPLGCSEVDDKEKKEVK